MFMYLPQLICVEVGECQIQTKLHTPIYLTHAWIEWIYMGIKTGPQEYSNLKSQKKEYSNLEASPTTHKANEIGQST